MNRFWTFVVLLMLTGSVSGQAEAPLQNIRPFTEVKGQPDFPATPNFEFTTSGQRYRISGNGRGSRTGGGISSRRFDLRLGKEDSLERVVYHANYQTDIVLICEISAGDGGAGFITRLDGRTLRMKWKRWIPAFNVGQGLIDDDFAYVTAHGFVGRVDLRSGTFAWSHDGLYRDHKAYNVFELPKIEGGAVLFKEQTIYDSPPKTLRVDRHTGKIISID